MKYPQAHQTYNTASEVLQLNVLIFGFDLSRMAMPLVNYNCKTNCQASGVQLIGWSHLAAPHASSSYTQYIYIYIFTTYLFTLVIIYDSGGSGLLHTWMMVDVGSGSY